MKNEQIKCLKVMRLKIMENNQIVREIENDRYYTVYMHT